MTPAPNIHHTRLDFEEQTDPPGLYVVGPVTTLLSKAHRALLGERVKEVDPMMLLIQPLGGEIFWLHQTGPHLDDTLCIAYIGPYAIKVLIDPAHHDRIEVLPKDTGTPNG